MPAPRQEHFRPIAAEKRPPCPCTLILNPPHVRRSPSRSAAGALRGGAARLLALWRGRRRALVPRRHRRRAPQRCARRACAFASV
eukprot:21219-Prymnesium_polylepis.1